MCRYLRLNLQIIYSKGLPIREPRVRTVDSIMYIECQKTKCDPSEALQKSALRN